MKFGINLTDRSYGTFLNFLNYKLEWLGKKLVKVDRYFPSSKLCSKCGYKNKALQLSDREWTCPNCGEKHNRDENAAKNILGEAIKQIKAGAQPDSLLTLELLDSLSKKPPLQSIIA